MVCIYFIPRDASVVPNNKFNKDDEMWSHKLPEGAKIDTLVMVNSRIWVLTGM